MVKYNGYEIKTRKFPGMWEATVLCNGVEVAKYMGFTRDEALAFAKAFTEESSPCPDLEDPDDEPIIIGNGDDSEDPDPEDRLSIYTKYISECSYTRSKAKKALKKWDPEMSDDDLTYLLDGWQSSRDQLDCPPSMWEGLEIDAELLLKIGLFVFILCALSGVLK